MPLSSRASIAATGWGSGRAKCLPAFQSYFGFEVFNVTPDARDSGELVARSENHGDIFGFQIAGYTRAIVTVAVTDIMHMEIEMVAPEKWWHYEGFVRAKHISGGSLALALCDDPVLDANAPCARIGPPGDVAGRENARYVRLQTFID